MATPATTSTVSAAIKSTVNNTEEKETFLDVSVLKELARKALVDALNSVNGAKTLVLDPSLAGPLGLITEVALLKHHGVDKMFWLEAGPLSATTTNIVYLCRPQIKHVKIIADHIKRHGREGEKHTYTLFLVPRTSTLISKVLEEEGVLGDVTVAAYNLQFIPLAEDVISLEQNTAFKEIWVDGDETVTFNSMQALITLQSLHGLFPRIVGKGDHAARLANLLTKHVPTTVDGSPGGLFGSLSDKLDSLIILDRKVDMITPLLTQLTYEGLIDELIGIKNSHVELPISLVSPPAAAQGATGGSTSTNAPTPPATSLTKEKKKKHHLSTASDPLLTELRDLNFSAVGRRLNHVARRLDEDYKLRHQAKTPAQLREFVSKLGGLQTEHQSLRLHTGISELLMPQTKTEEFNKSLEIQQNLLASYETNAQISAIEDLLSQGADMQVVLRLLCLASIITGGIKAKTLENIKRDFLQTYGYNYLPMLLSLAAPPLSALLPNPPLPSTAASAASAKYPYSSLRKSLRLLIEDPDPLEELENDISYVYSGYAPISIRLVQCIAQKGGVLSNPAGEKDKRISTTTDDNAGRNSAMPKVHAHPIVGWKGFEDVVASIPGQTFDMPQKVPGSADGSNIPPISNLLLPKDQQTTTVVFFLGGCTYTEIAALRWVGRQNKGRKFLIATTGIISGRSMIESIAGLGQGVSSKEAGL